MTITRDDMTHQVRQIHAPDYEYVDAIVDRLIDRYGTVDINTIYAVDYWTLVQAIYLQAERVPNIKMSSPD